MAKDLWVDGFVEAGTMHAGLLRLKKHGPSDFAAGDRVQLTDTNKRARLYNGNVGTIIAIDAETGEIRVRLDAPTGQQGRKVKWTASAFTGFRHGYVGTIYKGQGKTLDHTYLYHTHQGRAKSR